MPSTLNSPPSTTAWYAVHAKPRQETTALLSLQREKVETFFPRLRRKRTIRRVRKWVTGPLFPGYFFARFDPAQDGRLVRYANGVINVVSFGGHPAVVEPALIAAIRDHCDCVSTRNLQPATLNSQLSTILPDTVTIQPQALRPGDVVEIQTGPFRGMQGVFEREMSGQERVVILLEVLAKTTRVQVSREQLEKVAS